jgi:hypothetical protein
MKPIRIEPPTEESRHIWSTFLELATALVSTKWVLVGGLMVQLHAFERNETVRPTTDVDLLGDARKRPSSTRTIAQVLDLKGSLVSTRSDRKLLALRWDTNGVPIDVLAPDGLKSPAKTSGGLETLSVPGGTQALGRAEQVMVVLDGQDPVAVMRPDLLGAILLKARVMVKGRKKFDSDRQDFIRLLTLVEDPRELAKRSKLKKTEVKWLNKATKKADLEDRSLVGLFEDHEIAAARQSLELLQTSI